jgi:hypothetical protein
MLTAADAPALPALPLLLGALVVVTALAGSLVLLGRRRRAGRGAGEGAPVTGEPAGAAEDAADLAAEDSLPEDPRALRLLVRSLEAALEELSADAARQPEEEEADHTEAEPVEAEDEPVEPEAESVEPEPTPPTAAVRRDALISAVLAQVGDADRTARLDAALQRSRAPRSFSRPTLAACLGAEVPPLRAVRAAPEEPLPGGPVADAAPEDVVAPPPAAVEPTEPERVLPVPAEPVPDIAPRRRLFGRRVA